MTEIHYCDPLADPIKEPPLLAAMRREAGLEQGIAKLEEQLRNTVPREEFMAAVFAGVETGRELRRALRRCRELEAQLRGLEEKCQSEQSG